MVYRHGDFGISIDCISGFGKNPGLWIHKGNTAIKVASFGSFEKAEDFRQYFEYFCFPNAKEPKANDKEEQGDDT